MVAGGSFQARHDMIWLKTYGQALQTTRIDSGMQSSMLAVLCFSCCTLAAGRTWSVELAVLLRPSVPPPAVSWPSVANVLAELVQLLVLLC